MLGPTGSGKSTIANAIISGATIEIFEEDLRTGFIKTKDDLYWNGRKMFEIGH